MKKIFLMTAFCAMAFTSCSRNPVEADCDITKEEPAAQIQGTAWKLVGIGGESFSYGVSKGITMKPVKEDFRLHFLKDSVGGQAPANTFATSYVAADNSIRFGEIMWSGAYCGDGSVEPEFFHRMESTASYTIRRDTLFLKEYMIATDDEPSSAQGQGIMKFVRVQ